MKNSYIFILVGFCIGSIWRIEAAEPYHPHTADPLLEHWRWQLYPELNGLGLQCLTEGPDGAMWFGTEYGVLKYDGVSWVTYSHADGLVGNTIWDLFFTQDGVLFAGSDQGMSRFENGHWQRVFPEENLHIRCWDFLEDQNGNLWVGTEWGALCFQDDKKIMYTSQDVAPVITHFLPDIETVIVPAKVTGRGGINEPIQNAGIKKQYGMRGRTFDVYDVFEDREGYLWFGRAQVKMVVRFAVQDTLLEMDARWQVFTNDEIEVSKKSRVFQTQDDAIWVICENSKAGINRFDGVSWETFAPESFVGVRRLNFSMLETRDGQFWVGEHGGIFKFHNGGWVSYAEDKVPIPKWTPTVDLLEASDGAIWVAGRGKEAARIDYTDKHWKTYNGLMFQCETPDGATWFLNWDLEAVRFDGETWVKYTVADGLMDTPVVLFATTKGELWAGGSHDEVAATARFDGEKWTFQQHPSFAWRVHMLAAFEASDGTLWFGADIPEPNPNQQGGFACFDGEKWVYTKPADLKNWTRLLGVGETADGRIWGGGLNLMYCFDGQRWEAVTEPAKMLQSKIQCMISTAEKELWVGTNTGGVFQYNGDEWIHHTIQTGLPDHHIQRLQQTQDGTIWAETGKGFARYDGQRWTHDAMPFVGGRLFQAKDGALWFNQANTVNDIQNRNRPGDLPFQREPVLCATQRYYPHRVPPETKILTALEEVSQPGNTVISWDGVSPWKKSEALQFSYRLNDEPWSVYSDLKSVTLLEMDSGAHTFSVRARDRDFNVDATPAVISFVVIPPVWQQPWFVSLMLFGGAVIGYLSVRLVKRNKDLSVANKNLYDVNADLQQKTDALALEMAERERLDTHIQNLQFLYHLRNDLNATQSPQQIVHIVGEAIQNVLGESGQTQIVLDDRMNTFGTLQEAVYTYKRALRWSDRERGSLQIGTTVSLSESQERTLLDEVAGQLSGVIEARELQMQLLQSARLMSLGQMAAGVAHELNQPLGALSNVVNDVYLRLRDGIDMSEEDLSQMMQDSMGVVNRMSETINQLRVFSRDEAQAPPEPFDLNATVTSSLKLVGTQLKNHGVDLQLDLAKDLPLLMGHGHQMEQVVLNLLANARDAVLDGGKDKRVFVRSYKEGEVVGLEVCDRGVGISEEYVGRVFEPFFTTKSADKGTGLGLSISYAIVKNHGGDIVCESTMGEGSVFRVVFTLNKGKDAGL